MTAKKVRLPFMKLFVDHWLSDECLGKCSLAARGLWVDILCHMHNNGQTGLLTGTTEELARICRCFPSEIETNLRELKDTKTADVTFCNGLYQICNRRMNKEHKQRESIRLRVEKHRANNACNRNETGYITEYILQSTEKENIKEKITFNFDTGQFEGISSGKKSQWAAAFPAVDVEMEIKSAALWAADNPAKRKSNWGRFLTNWFRRTQERGGSNANGVNGRKIIGSCQQQKAIDGRGSFGEQVSGVGKTIQV